MDMWICLALITLKCNILHDIKSFIPDLSTTISQLSQVIPEVIHRNIHVDKHCCHAERSEASLADFWVITKFQGLTQWQESVIIRTERSYLLAAL